MKNTLRVNHADRTIIMDRTFAKYAENTMSNEYAHLQQVRRDYPNYTVMLRQIKRNSNKKTYNGLTYEFMEDYALRSQCVILHIEGWLLLQHGAISNLLRSTQRNSPSINGCELYYNLLFL